MKFEIFLGRLFLSIISICLAFILFNYASKWFFPKSISVVESQLELSTGAYRKPKPYVMFGGSPNAEYNPGERLNNLGYRGKVPLPAKAPGEFRIFLLGGSTVFFGEPPIAVLLEAEFSKNGHKNVNVYNFGVLSSVSGMELARILFEISDFKPDLIVMYGGGNDLTQPPYWDPRPGYPFNFMAFENNPLIESEVNKYPTLAMLAYGSNLFRHLFPSYFVNTFVPLKRLRVESHWGAKEWEDKMASVYVDNLIKADKVSRTFGANFIAFFQPLVYYKKNLSKEEEPLTGSEMKDYEYMREHVRTLIGKNSSKSSLAFVDISDIFAGTRDTVFIDRIHIVQDHYNDVAKMLYKHIAGYVK